MSILLYYVTKHIGMVSNITLPSFIKFLEEKELLNFEKFDFDTRLKIQKFVYLSELFGMNWEHTYNMYRYGPYSTSLAESYYELHESKNREIITNSPSMPDSFRNDEFMLLVDRKNSDWLEVSATLVDQSKRFSNDEMLVKHVESIKSNYSVDFINSVLQDLQAQHVLD